MDIARNITVSSFDIPYCCSGVKHHSPQTGGVWNDADASELLLTNLQEVYGYAGTSRPKVKAE
jgi:hypothetical protein